MGSETRRRSLQTNLGQSSPGSLSEPLQQQMVTVTAGITPFPAKCSAQLRRLLQEHSVNIPPPKILDSPLAQPLSHSQKQCPKDNISVNKDNFNECPEQITEKTASASASESIPVLNPALSFPPPSNSDARPIYPHLPYSPYGSPTTSPRVRRKPLRETTRVNSVNDQSGEFVQLNQYKVEGAIGQVNK